MKKRVLDANMSSLGTFSGSDGEHSSHVHICNYDHIQVKCVHSDQIVASRWCFFSLQIKTSGRLATIHISALHMDSFCC